MIPLCVFGAVYGFLFGLVLDTKLRRTNANVGLVRDHTVTHCAKIDQLEAAVAGESDKPNDESGA